MLMKKKLLSFFFKFKWHCCCNHLQLQIWIFTLLYVLDCSLDFFFVVIISLSISSSSSSSSSSSCISLLFLWIYSWSLFELLSSFVLINSSTLLLTFSQHLDCRRTKRQSKECDNKVQVNSVFVRLLLFQCFPVSRFTYFLVSLSDFLSSLPVHMYIATCGCAFTNLTTKCDIKNKLPNK